MFQRIAKPFRISIHALLAESDASTRIDTDNNSDFYPRSPCGERHQECSGSQHPPDFYPRSPCGERLFEYIQAGTGILFLSTLSLRRATTSTTRTAQTRCIFLSTLSLRRATTRSQPSRPKRLFLSTLSLRRATTWQRGSRVTYVEFLSTLSLRRATFDTVQIVIIVMISIHALLAESDLLEQSASYNAYLISIHALLAESDNLVSQ